MTRQMADDEVLRVLDDAAYELHNYTPDAPQPMRDVRDYVAALQAERDAKTAQLAQCFRMAGADPDGNEDWRIAQDAVRAVTDLRRDYDEACEEMHGPNGYAKRAERAESALEALRGQVAGLVEKWRAESDWTGVTGTFADELNALLAIKERMG